MNQCGLGSVTIVALMRVGAHYGARFIVSVWQCFVGKSSMTDTVSHTASQVIVNATINSWVSQYSIFKCRRFIFAQQIFNLNLKSTNLTFKKCHQVKNCTHLRICVRDINIQVSKRQWDGCNVRRNKTFSCIVKIFVCCDDPETLICVMHVIIEFMTGTITILFIYFARCGIINNY